MKGVFLDTESVLPADLDLAALQASLDDWQFYSSTSQQDVGQRITGADVVVTNKTILDARDIAAAPRLKLIAVTATGTNNVDLGAAASRNILVCNARNYGSSSVAQHAFALILALATNLLNYSRDVRQARWQKSSSFCLLDHPIADLQDKNLVIVGYGAIGRVVSDIGRAFGMQVHVAASVRADAVADGRTPLHELLPIADVLSLHCPLTTNTKNLIDRREMKLMKSSALLINVARGGLVNESSLLEALLQGEIGGAGLDVLSEEPPVNGNPLLDHDLPNLVITPHCAWGSREARQRLIDHTADNIRAFVAGRPQNQVTT